MATSTASAWHKPPSTEEQLPFTQTKVCPDNIPSSQHAACLNDGTQNDSQNVTKPTVTSVQCATFSIPTSPTLKNSAIPVPPKLPSGQPKMYRIANREVDNDLSKLLPARMPMASQIQKKLVEESQKRRLREKELQLKRRLENGEINKKDDQEPPVINSKTGQGVWQMVDHFEMYLARGDTIVKQGLQSASQKMPSMNILDERFAADHSSKEVGIASKEVTCSTPVANKPKFKSRRVDISKRHPAYIVSSSDSSSSLDITDSCRYTTETYSSSDSDDDSDEDDLMISQELKHGFANNEPNDNLYQTIESRYSFK